MFSFDTVLEGKKKTPQIMEDLYRGDTAVEFFRKNMEAMEKSKIGQLEKNIQL